MQAVGHALNEHLTFSILNPTEEFQVGPTSGVVQVCFPGNMVDSKSLF